MEQIKNKKVLGIIALILLLVGFFLLNNSITGNVILEGSPSIDFFSVLGLFLVFCAGILALQITKKAH